MLPPIAQVLTGNAAVTALLGAMPATRAYPHGQAPENVAKPYLVFQTIDNTPDNYLAQTPDSDGSSTQLDIYGATVASVRAVGRAVRDAFEFPVGYVTAIREFGRDPDTNLYRLTIEVDLITPRT